MRQYVISVQHPNAHHQVSDFGSRMKSNILGYFGAASRLRVEHPSNNKSIVAGQKDLSPVVSF